jgi:hypothetical protein
MLNKHRGCQSNNAVRFDVLTQVGIKITVLWNVTPFNLIYRYQHFRRTLRLHLQGRRLCRAALLWDVRCSRQNENYFLLGLNAVQFFRKVSTFLSTFASIFRLEECYPLTESVREIRGFPAVSRLRKRWRRVVHEPSFRGNMFCPEGGRYGPFRNCSSHPCSKIYCTTSQKNVIVINALWRHSKHNTRDFQLKAWNL